MTNLTHQTGVEQMKNLNEYFGRINENGNVDVFNNDGDSATRLDIHTLYPVGSSLSTSYEHCDGIELSISDFNKTGIELEN